MMRDCSVCECSPEEIPKPWLEEVGQSCVVFLSLLALVCVFAAAGRGGPALRLFLIFSQKKSASIQWVRGAFLF